MKSRHLFLQVSIPFREDLYSDMKIEFNKVVSHGDQVSIPFREDLYSDLNMF